MFAAAAIVCELCSLRVVRLAIEKGQKNCLTSFCIFLEPTMLDATNRDEPVKLPDDTPIAGSEKLLKKVKKKSTKKSRDPSTLTPEYIEEQRRIRQLKKEKKRQDLIASGIDPDQLEVPDDLRFRKRDFLSLPGSVEKDGFHVKIMTYNVLAQALIRRKLFPTSGNALKWSTRSQVLLSELKHYDADVLCLQELDYLQYGSFWKKLFEDLGYFSVFFRYQTKNHGVCIVFRKSLFFCKHRSFIDYDRESSGDVAPRTVTQNVGVLALLEFTPEVLQKHPGITKNGVIIGTTHLFWHPFGTYDRTRQTYLVLKKFQDFYNVHNALLDNYRGFYSFFAGDFNSQPFDSPYLSITAKPVTYTKRANDVLGCSLSYQYSKNRGVVEGTEDEGDDEEEEGGNVEKFGKDQPRDPVPETFEATEEQLQKIESIRKLHNDLDIRAISLYSVGYGLVDPDNSGLLDDSNEPFFSNWAHTWRGLLDYIFVISKWDAHNEDYSKRVDSVDEVSLKQGVKLTKLLRLPLPKDMGPEPSGQPRLGQFPSDHLCMMAEVELC